MKFDSKSLMIVVGLLATGFLLAQIVPSVVGIILLIALGIGGYVLSQRSTKIFTSSKSTEEMSPREHLREQYSEGKISEEEFERRLDVLMQAEQMSHEQKEEEKILR